MASYKSRAPKPEKLREDETLSSFEAWRGNLEYYLALDENFAEFLEESFTWKPKSSDIHRGLTDIPLKDENDRISTTVFSFTYLLITSVGDNL